MKNWKWPAADFMRSRYQFRGHDVLQIEKPDGKIKWRIDGEYREFESEREAREAVIEIIKTR